ncbi:caspase-8-like isoform X2 [Haliotis rubra]|uniref:caspase-8-like isoform X2 n=1 Tax=Haliotis rubra TaxID=36100 RepID=UPI001EE561FE|nr:caspase-8-like isoform X2 [Haliotis rubra]XP_046558565.1 caspase-8-like isoform X2 [Haliotis rubra]XP_046558566.1 caspase-8-like isoform X2 [Haliotis rubra]XP_046558567.1 caspase-8-like isoform X2 [Haliotis rubra]XP_046558568.1 caspase-8-like isoform X2 [Haliotis rubra]XP_046558569.1 caspase-8-like isoform X2 [Haliotis rubra]XP_046558571.1 caspase-8-like isoform X2 [Haliotis rubra]
MSNQDIKVTGVEGGTVGRSIFAGIVHGGMGNNVTTNHNQDADGSGQGQEAPYKMDSVPRGLCYIFSNKTFENKPDKKRIGVEKDRDALTKVWEKLHFVVKSFDDSNANVMETRLKELAEMDHKAYNCVVVIFLTHGRDGAVQGSDNEWLEVSTITSYFKASVCPSLANKPKLFFFQSCRGNERQKAVPVQGDGGGNDVVGSEAILVKMVAPNADFFFGFATVAGMQALRNAETGSWFIQSLVQALEASTKRDDLDSIMTTVRRKVDDHQCETSDGKFLRQTAEVRSTLRKKLYFTY